VDAFSFDEELNSLAAMTLVQRGVLNQGPFYYAHTAPTWADWSSPTCMRVAPFSFKHGPYTPIRSPSI